MPSNYVNILLINILNIEAKVEGISGDGVIRIIRCARLFERLPFVTCSICDDKDGISRSILPCKHSVDI